MSPLIKLREEICRKATQKVTFPICLALSKEHTSMVVRAWPQQSDLSFVSSVSVDRFFHH